MSGRSKGPPIEKIKQLEDELERLFETRAELYTKTRTEEVDDELLEIRRKINCATHSLIYHKSKVVSKGNIRTKPRGVRRQSKDPQTELNNLQMRLDVLVAERKKLKDASIRKKEENKELGLTSTIDIIPMRISTEITDIKSLMRYYRNRLKQQQDNS